MRKYLAWNRTKIVDFSDQNITKMYNKGFVFTRIGRGIMSQTRSIRIPLDNFSLTSENRRVIKKTNELIISEQQLPISMADYDWSIQKLAKEYYRQKFGEKVFSVNKIKYLLSSNESNFNLLLKYTDIYNETVGYSIVFTGKEIFHYAYPFYFLDKYRNNYGMSMMIHSILYSIDKGCRYIYLGSGSTPLDIYKTQFRSLEWYNYNYWEKDIDKLKNVLKNA